MKTETVKGKVIQILNEYYIVVNLGKDKVKVGDFLNILGAEIQIKNKINDTDLGHFSVIKESVKVYEVFEDFSICVPHKKKIINSPMVSAINPLIKQQEVPKPLNVSSEDNENIKLDEDTIKIGDSVVLK